MVKRLETREVLAAAYRHGRGVMHTHTVAIADDGEETALCPRVKVDNLTWTSATVASALPTCPYCLAKVRKIPDAVRVSLFQSIG